MEKGPEKKIEVVTKDGRIIRIMPHMLEDASRFEVTVKKPAVRETPKELLDIPQKSVLPKMLKTEPEPEPEPAPVKRKPPVRSKSTK